MAPPPPAKLTPPRPRLRFTLAGLFLCLLGIAVGLAYWRLPQGTLAHGLFASFGAWLLMGQFQRLVDAIHQHRIVVRQASRASHWRFPSNVAAPLSIIFLIAVAAWTDLNLRLGWHSWFSATSMLGWPQGTSLSWAAGQLRESIFFLAVILAYRQPLGASAVHSPRVAFVRSLGAAILLGLCFAFGAVVIWSIISTESFIIALVHYAIRGVQGAQPLRWAGRPFSSPVSPSDHLLGDFLHGAIAAAALVVAAVLAALIAFGKWRSGRAISVFMMGLHAVCLVAAGRFLATCYNSVLPELSPFMREAIFDQPLVIRLLAALVVLTTAILLAQRLATRIPGENPFVAQQPGHSMRYLHERWGVSLVCLLGIAALIVPGVVKQLAPAGTTLRYDWRPWIAAAVEYASAYPHHLLACAAFLALSNQIWKEWRERRSDEHRTEVNPGLFIAIVCSVTVTLVIGAPVLTWLGCAITLMRMNS